MSVSTSIFLSAIFLGIVALFIATKVSGLFLRYVLAIHGQDPKAFDGAYVG